MGDLPGLLETRWIPGFALASLVAFGAYRLRALTRSGAIAAVILGGTIVVTAGWWPAIVLVVFFVTSSALSMHSSTRSDAAGQVRGKRRDAVQVLANGGIAALCAIASAVAADGGPWLVALVSAVAGAASDTWATEIGQFSRSQPRLITSLREAPRGTSGAISAVGTLGSIAGSLLIALTAAAGARLGGEVPGISAWSLAGIVAVAGLAGSIVDSLFGATVQAVYRCPACDQTTEQRVHRCGTATVHARGLRWMDNDTVNLAAIAASASIGLTLGLSWPLSH